MIKLAGGSFVKIYKPATFLLYDLECIFLKWIYIQLNLEFKNDFVKYHPVSLKMVFGTTCIMYENI